MSEKRTITVNGKQLGETKTKYRFKTLEEFDKEFKKDGNGGYIVGKYPFIPSMFHFAGVPIPDEFSEQIMSNPDGSCLNLGDIVEGKDNYWYFTPEMLTLNELENVKVEVVSKMENTESGIEIRGKVYPITPQDCEDVLKSIGKFVFSKAPEGDFPDLTYFKGAKVKARYSEKQCFYSAWIKAKFGRRSFKTDSGTVKEIEGFPELTPEEIVEKLGKDYLLNLIKEKENETNKI